MSIMVIAGSVFQSGKIAANDPDAQLGREQAITKEVIDL
jgi:hypothetical protein